MAINRVNLEDVISDAKVALEAGNPDRAIALCYHIFNFYPRCLEAARMLGEAYTEQRHFSEAEQLFIFVLSADPQDVLGYVDRGFIAYEQNHLDDAILYCERALELDPSIEQLREELLRLYRERQPGVKAQIRMSKVALANARLRDGLYGQAIEEYTNVLRQTPNRLDVQVSLMEAYWRNRDYGRAEQLAQELIENNAFLVKANLVLWHIYGVRRNQERAADYLERAHALDPLNLLAERLFEDSASASETLNYISMLGVPVIPAPDMESLNAQLANQKSLVPEWASGGSETDVVLGLKSDLPSVSETEAVAGPNMGLDLFALLSDTEKHVAEHADQDDGLYPETEEDPEGGTATSSKAAQTSSDEMRHETGGEESDPFHLFEEVESPGDAAFVPAVKPAPAQAAPGAFDLDFSIAKEGDLSLFEEIEQRMAHEPASENEAFEPDNDSKLAASPVGGTVSTGSISPDIAPFTFDEDASPPEFMQNIPPFFADNEPASPTASGTGQAAPLAREETEEAEAFALPPLEPFTFDEDAEPAAVEKASAPDEPAIKPAFQFQDLYATEDASNQPTEQFRFDAFEVAEPISGDSDADITPKSSSLDTFEPVEPAEAPGLPLEPEPEPRPIAIPTPSSSPDTADTPGGQDQSESSPDQPAIESPGLPETQPGAEPDRPLPLFESDAAFASEPAFQGQVAPASSETNNTENEGAFAAAASPASETFEVYREPYAFYKRDEQGDIPDFALDQMAQDSSLPAFGGLDDLDTGAATEGASAGSPASPNTLQENSQMPIRRGQENLNDLFDWEREELPDYLQPFALDEDEINQSDLGPESPYIADVNTPPARIRSREDTGPTNLGDLPSWLVNDSPAIPETPASPAEDDATGFDRLEMGTRALPSWLNQSPSGANLPPSNSPAFDDSDFGDLAPFNLDENNDFGAPPPAPSSPPQPAANGFNPAAFDPTGDLEPFRLDDDTGGFEPPAPPMPPQPLPDISNEARRPAGEAAAPPAPAPAFDLGLDMDDLKPFSFEEFDTAMPAPPSSQASNEPAAPPVSPSAFAADEDFDDLLPFNLEDDGTQTIPPPLAFEEPAAPDQVPFADQLRHTGPLASTQAGSVEAGIEEMQPFSLADFDDLPVNPPGIPAPSAPAQGAQADFDFEPFSWNTEGENLFGGADAANFNPFEPSGPTGYAQPAPPPQPAAPEPGDDKPLRNFEWSKPRSSEPEQAPANPEPSLFEKLVARRRQSDILATRPLTEPATERPAQTGSAETEITGEDLLPIAELEARAAENPAGLATKPLTQPERAAATPTEILDAAVAAEKTSATVEPTAEATLPQAAYAEAPDVPPGPEAKAAQARTVQPQAAIEAPQPLSPAQPVREAAVPAQSAPAPSPTQDNLQKAMQSFAQQDYNQSLNSFNQAVKTADKTTLPEIISKLKEVTDAPDANPRFHRVLGDAYKKQGQFQAALAEYSKALAGAGAKK
jgi:tetratricopeptide (TPR) repeat protein